MKIAVVGSRSITGYIDFTAILPDNIDLIISGGANGVDTLAEEYADRNGIEKLIIKPDYKRYQRRAPLIRDCEMVDLCDAVVAVWDGSSRGTAYTVKYAVKTGKPVKLMLNGEDVSHRITELMGK